MMQTITQVATEAAKAAIMEVKEAEDSVNTARLVEVMLKIVVQHYNSQHLTRKQQPNTKNYKILI